MAMKVVRPALSSTPTVVFDCESLKSRSTICPCLKTSLSQALGPLPRLSVPAGKGDCCGGLRMGLPKAGLKGEPATCSLACSRGWLSLVARQLKSGGAHCGLRKSSRAPRARDHRFQKSMPTLAISWRGGMNWSPVAPTPKTSVKRALMPSSSVRFLPISSMRQFALLGEKRSTRSMVS